MDLHVTYIIPKKMALRKKIIQYSKILLDNGLEQLRGNACGIAVDGATLAYRHAYAFIIVHPFGLRFAGIKHVNHQISAKLSSIISSTIKECEKHGIIISGIVSDNAPSLVRAIEKNDPKDESTLLFIIGKEIKRCSCAAHTAQLVIPDACKMSPDFNTFANNVPILINWLKERRKFFPETIPKKFLNYITTRWNTLYQCSQFLLEYKEDISYFIFNRSQIETDEYNKALQKHKDDKPLPKKN